MESQDKPLHVRVAEALGWSAWLSKQDYWIITEPDGTRHEDGYGQPNPKFDPQTGEQLPPRQWWDEYDPPRYDTDWSATGPLIERLGICLTWESDGRQIDRWNASDNIPEQAQDIESGPTPLLAVCNLILALSAAGKLR